MALSWLDAVKGQFPAVTDDCNELQGFFEKKYWHELTQTLLAIVRKPEWQDAKLLMELYSDFVTHFEMKMNLFTLGQLVQYIAYKQTTGKAIELLQKVSELVQSKKHDEAYHFLKCEEAIHMLNEGSIENKKAAKEIIEASVKFLERRNASSLHLDLRANIYRAEATVYRVEKKYDTFYRKCLLFVAHKKTEELPVEEQQTIARDLGKAALLGKNIHNFGELIHHPIFLTLNDSKDAWLAKLLRAYNTGDIAAYEEVTASHVAEMKQCFNESDAPFLRRKLQLMALLQHLFLTPVNNRTLTFKVIHEKCKTDSIDDVELLLLRALALDLIRGNIDEVDQVIEVTWIAARSLGKEEVNELAGQMKTWCKQVNGALRTAEDTLHRYEDEA